MGCVFSSNTLITIYMNNVDNYYTYSKCKTNIKFYRDQTLVLQQELKHTVLDIVQIQKNINRIEILTLDNSIIQTIHGPFTDKQFIKIQKFQTRPDCFIIPKI